jgi:hypothetical protein
VDSDDPVQSWVSLPRRIYLDTSTLQTMFDYGGVIFDGEPFEPVGRAAKVAGLADELEALHMIFLVNERARFEFVVTPSGLREVQGRNDRRYTQWIYDVRDTWLVQSEDEEIPPWGRKFDDRSFGNISAKDRILLQDALDWKCDAFMTMERRLPTRAEFIERKTGFRVMRPTTYWRLLNRWANLYY